MRKIIEQIKKLFKTAKGWIAVFLVTFPFWTGIYNAIDAWGNLQMIKDYLPSIWTFVDSTVGTITIMAIGFALLALALFRQKPLVGEAMIKEQAESIDKFVYVESINYIKEFYKHKTPVLLFVLRVFNTSVYEIALDSSISGILLFNSKKLQLSNTLALSPTVLEPNTKKDITFTHELSDEEWKQIQKAFNDAQDGNLLGFQYHNLKITVKGINESEKEIKSKHLKISKNSLEIMIEEDGFKILT